MFMTFGDEGVFKFYNLFSKGPNQLKNTQGVGEYLTCFHEQINYKKEIIVK